MPRHFDPTSTIIALATSLGPAQRGMIRLSGAEARRIVGECFVSSDGTDWQTARLPFATPGELRFPLADRSEVTVPARLYFWPGARSYTREPVAELHLISSPPILQAIIRRLCDAGARLAEPGEFTLRAFLAGRMDLTQAEAVLGVIDAHSAEQLSVALHQLAGNVARPLADVRGKLLDLVAHLEAGLDFVDEDIEFISKEELRRETAECAAAIEELAAKLNARTTSSAVVRVALVGLPSVGKSSLFNALTGQSALVDEVDGTTRDFLVAPLDVAGMRLELIDTAGLADGSATSIEAQAQTQARRQHAAADLRLLCLDATRGDCLTEMEQSWLASLDPHRAILVWTKGDRAEGFAPEQGFVISSRTGDGLNALRGALRAAATELQSTTGTILASTAARCGSAGTAAANAIARTVQLIEDSSGEELIAAELRGALHELGLVAGDVHTEDILDRVFSRFCIGK